MTIMAPKNKWELSDMMKFAVAFDGPIAIRYPRGHAYSELKEYRAPIVLGKAEPIYEEKDILLLAVGSMIPIAEKVHELLKEKGYRCSLTNARFVKPIDKAYIKEASGTHRLIVTMEENVASGGFGEAVRAYLVDNHLDSDILSVSIPDEFVTHGNVDKLREMLGIDAQSVADRIVDYLAR